MSKKQLGAVSDGEPAARGPRTWFSRLRAQPGFRTAAVAFVLTVVLGVGGPAAYAWWSQSSQVQISGATARQPLPTVSGEVQCYQPALVSVVRIVHTKVPSLPSDAFVIASVAGPGNQTRLYAVPNDGVFSLKELPGLSNSLSWGDRMSVTVTTAYLKSSPGNLPAAVDASNVLERAATAPAPASAYYLASFFC